MDSGYTTDDDVEKERVAPWYSRVSAAIAAMAHPFVSKKAQKAYTGSLFLFVAGICLAFVSVVAYAVFYYKLIPQVGLERVIHLQFGDEHPWGTARLDQGLVSLQSYDVTLQLELPRTSSNIAAGNFMLDLRLISCPPRSVSSGIDTSTPSIAQSRRPGILTYTSPLVDTASRISFMPLYLVGWKREVEKLEVPMMEQVQFARGPRNLPGCACLKIESKEDMQFYSAKLQFRARFTGLRRIMYSWRLTSFVVFTGLFWHTSMLFMLIVSALLFALPDHDNVWYGDSIKEEDQEDREETPIKEEPRDEILTPQDTSSESPSNESEKEVKREDEYGADEWNRWTSSRTRHNRRTSTGRGGGPSRSSGAGTALENERAIMAELQRRRSYAL
ncbi:hypothetical protein P168DRAFT_323373 [Aspergillus campestris IBT 28561]|uniref:Adipose-regulatory protein n=1 Tax=Aspergillus campestris (strain IBT 28561) TaxID=1392248 RepID=A0A2I1DE91_ASPC2|nr:uncharacterized protein P168DRAFT_323373 [Aspergillus campestris IBT 28561]PKY08195.1 hypothetical protein P168DRAFT_323373 [Aspergillus campestris IBT 28561]